MKKMHYAWVVCAMGFMLVFITVGSLANGFSILLPYIRDAAALTNTQTSSLVTIRCTVALIAMFTIKYYYDKLSYRLGTAIAAFCAAASYGVFALAHDYPLYCLGAVLAGFAYGYGAMIPVSIIMNNWFVRKKALALSICTTGSGLATILLPTVSTLLVENLSLNATFAIEGIFVLVMAVLIACFMRNSPEEKGVTAYGYGEENIHDHIKPPDASTVAARDLDRKEWILLGIVSFCMGTIANTGFSHISLLFRTSGYNALTIGTMLSCMGIILTFAKLAYGYITDKFGGLRSTVIFFIMLFAGSTSCCFAFTQSNAVLVVTVILLGIGYPIATIGPAVWANDMASSAKYARIVRNLQIMYAVGSLVTANLPGMIADRANGSYVPAFVFFDACMVIAFIAVILAYMEDHYRRKLAKIAKGGGKQ